MKNASIRLHKITVAQRALIIQRVIVDDWTSDKAAATFDVPERLVNAWVADYRRYGMASLHGASSKTLAAGIVPVTALRPAGAFLRRVSNGLRRFFAVDALVQPLPLRRSIDDGRGSGP